MMQARFGSVEGRAGDCGAVRHRRLATALAGVLLVACQAAPSPTPDPTPDPTPEPTPAYSYPDLPGDVEGTIASADCEHLEVLAEFFDNDSVAALTKAQATEAILHRTAELGGC